MSVRTFNLAMAFWIAGEIVGHFLGGTTTALVAGVATAVVIVIVVNLIDR